MTDYHDFTTKKTPRQLRRKLNIGDMWINSVRCLRCNEIIRSKNQHDFVWCKCKNVAVDGGSWYLKRVGGEKGYEDLSEMYDDVKDEN